MSEREGRGSTDAVSTEPKLARGIGRLDLAALVVNLVIGAGILGLPGHVYGLVGGWSLLVLGGVAALTAAFALCFAELSSRFDQTGGPYLYVSAAFGPTPGFLIGWLLWITRVLTVPTQLNLLLEYAAGPFPVVGEGAGRLLTIAAVVGGYTALTLSGVSVSARASTGVTVAKLALFGAFVAAGALALDPARFALAAAPEPAALSDAVLLLLFAFVGFESVTIVAGETREARRSVPMGVLGGMAVVALVYAAVLAVTVSVLPDPATPGRAVAAAAEAMAGPLGASAATAGVVVVLLGAMIGGFILTPRLLYALAERGQLPAVLARVHPRTRTPHVAILASAAVVLVLTVFNSFLSALVLATAVRLVTYIACCGALLRLRRRGEPPAAFTAPWGRVLAVVGAGIAAVVLVVSALEQLVWTAAAAVAGLALLYLARRRSA